jgi:phage repressor protein C with HTH and peptisase S24 domain
MNVASNSNSDSFRERLGYFHKEYLGMPQYVFAESIGLGQERVRKSLMPDKQPTAEFFEAIFTQYPDLNPDWVFTGRGAMLHSKEETLAPYMVQESKPDSSQLSGKNLRVLCITNDSSGNENVEVVASKAAASYIDNIQEPQFLTTLPKISLPGNQFRGGTFRAFEVKGNSMEPTIQQGSWVIGQYVQDWHTLKDDYIYIIVMQDAILIKRVLNRIDNRQGLVLKSDNREYENKNIDIDDVRELWLLKAEMRYNFKNPSQEMYLQLQHLMADVEDIKNQLAGNR